MEKSKQKIKKVKAPFLDELEKAELTKEQHIRLLSILNKKLNIFPIHDTIRIVQGQGIFSDGRKLEMNELAKLRVEVSAMRDNYAFHLILSQIEHEAVKNGVHYGDTPEKIMFSKSVLYATQKLREYLNQLDTILH